MPTSVSSSSAPSACARLALRKAPTDHCAGGVNVVVERSERLRSAIAVDVIEHEIPPCRRLAFFARIGMGKPKKGSKKAFQKLIGIMQTSYPGRETASVPQELRYSLHELRDEIVAVKYLVKMILRRMGVDPSEVNDGVRA